MARAHAGCVAAYSPTTAHLNLHSGAAALRSARYATTSIPTSTRPPRRPSRSSSRRAEHTVHTPQSHPPPAAARARSLATGLTCVRACRCTGKPETPLCSAASLRGTTATGTHTRAQAVACGMALPGPAAHPPACSHPWAAGGVSCRTARISSTRSSGAAPSRPSANAPCATARRGAPRLLL